VALCAAHSQIRVLLAWKLYLLFMVSFFYVELHKFLLHGSSVLVLGDWFVCTLLGIPAALLVLALLEVGDT
jgi:hypothetical protein